MRFEAAAEGDQRASRAVQVDDRGAERLAARGGVGARGAAPPPEVAEGRGEDHGDEGGNPDGSAVADEQRQQIHGPPCVARRGAIVTAAVRQPAGLEVSRP